MRYRAGLSRKIYEVSSAVVARRSGLTQMVNMMKTRRMQWFAHVQSGA